jgi:hypothetical protein
MSNTNVLSIVATTPAEAVPFKKVTLAQVWSKLEEAARASQKADEAMAVFMAISVNYVISLWITEQAKIAKLKPTEVDKLRAIKQTRYEAYDGFLKLAADRLFAMKPTTKLESHKRTFRNHINAEAANHEGYTKPKSQTKAALALSEARGTKAKATPKAEVKTTAPADMTPYDKRMTASDMKKEIMDTMQGLYDTLAGHLPAGKVKEYQSLQAAFIQSTTKLINAK